MNLYTEEYPQEAVSRTPYQENQMDAAKQQRSYHDEHAVRHTFNVNDIVWGT